ncbi:hypothetical protein GCM10023169_36720 [Georgenia halophila]|uniref:Uncharacterized protein n=1 Tax=Georgenia halophila TaxID=620889 RepID=A0ABP8LMQ1_9MICO
MPTHPDIDLVVLDVLGTLVDEPGGLRSSIREVAPDVGNDRVDDLVEVWQSHVAHQQREMLDGRRPYANSDVVDREAAEFVATRCGVTQPGDADPSQRPRPAAMALSALGGGRPKLQTGS